MKLIVKKRLLTVIILWLLLGFALLIYLLVTNRSSADLFPPPQTSEVPPIPDLDRWFANWQKYGEKYYCSKEQIEANGIIETGANTYSAWYYDGMWGAYKLSDRVSTTAEKNKWALCATYFRKPYRDDYVLKNNGKIPGWRIFPRGLYEDYLRTGDIKSKEALILMAKNAAYAYRNVSPSASIWHPAYSREVAYNIDAYLLAKKLAPTDPAFRNDDPYIDVALHHLDKWIEWLSNSPRTTKCDCGSAGLQPFMVGLTIKSLYYVYLEIANSTRAVDQAIVSKIKDKVPRILDLLWEEAWGENHPEESGGAQAFYYGSNTRDYQGKEDLNLLIAPAYAFAWRLTGQDRFRIRADKIFSAGVRKANLDYMGKIFSQNYFFSDQYVDLRKISVLPTSQPQPPINISSPQAPLSTNAPNPSPIITQPSKTTTLTPAPQTQTSVIPSHFPSAQPESLRLNKEVISTLPITREVYSGETPSPQPSLYENKRNISSTSSSANPPTAPLVSATPKILIEFADSQEGNILSENNWQPVRQNIKNTPEYTSSPIGEGIKLNKKITLAGKPLNPAKNHFIYLEISNPNPTAIKAKIKLAVGITLKNNQIKLYWNKVKPQTATFLPYKTQVLEFKIPSSSAISAIAIDNKKPLLERLKELFSGKKEPLFLKRITYKEE